MPSRSEAIRIQREQDAMMRYVEAPYERTVIAEKTRILKASVEAYRMTNRPITDEMIASHYKNMSNIAFKFQERAVQLFGRYIFQGSKYDFVRVEYKDGVEDLFGGWMRDWMGRSGYKNAKDAADTTFNDIRKALVQSVERQETTREVIKRIQSVGIVNSYRARTIAQTETHNAAMYASKETALEIERMTEEESLKYWCSAEDERTREAHIAMNPDDGIPLNDTFNVGGEEMDRPGDDSASADNVINCRCVLTYS